MAGWTIPHHPVFMFVANYLIVVPLLMSKKSKCLAKVVYKKTAAKKITIRERFFMYGLFIPCQNCGQQYTQNWIWYVCNCCGFHICQSCLCTHQEPYGSGFKCSRCAFGQMRRVE